MAEESQNNNQIPAAEIPTSRANIEIRTQETDVESLKQTGRAHPLPETVSVNTEVSAPAPAPVPDGTQISIPAAAPAVHTLKPRISFAWAFWLIGLAVLFLIGYFVLPLFFG